MKTRARINQSTEGLREIRTSGTVDEFIDRLTTLLSSKHVTVFAIIDHAGEARKAGATMRDTKLVIFGDPKSGTPVMLARPSAAIDLPLKLLVFEESDGAIVVAYNTTEYIARRHDVPAELVRNISSIDALVAALVSPAAH